MTRIGLPLTLLAAALLLPVPSQAAEVVNCKKPPERVGKLRAKDATCAKARKVSQRYVDYCPLRSDCNVQLDYKIWKCKHGDRTVCTLGTKKVSFIDKR